jgi:hypothetical protein
MQVYGGVVYLNLRAHAVKDGIGTYEYLPEDKLPALWLMHTDAPSSSGVVHAPVRQRWSDGDSAVLEGVQELAAIADTGRYATLKAGCCRKQTWSLFGNWCALHVSGFQYLLLIINLI